MPQSDALDYTIAHIAVAIVVAMFATLGTTILGLSMGWIPEGGLNLVEMFAVLTSYACTYLCVMQVRAQYVFAAITTILYVYVFYTAGLYGSALANLYLPIALVYGWFRWGPDGRTREVTWTNPVYYLGYSVLGVGGWAITYYSAQNLGIDIPVLDSVILVLTIIAQFMMDNKKVECWIIWSVLNVIAIYLYFQSGLFLAGSQYILFLINAFWGFYQWYKSIPIIEKHYAR